jgi:arylesterase/paraoxonase
MWWIEIVLHQPTRHVFAACSTSRSRTHWLPAVHHLNASGRATDDFIAVLDPASHSVRNLTLSGFTDRRGLNSHGMDVVPSATSTSELFVYLVNQRPPFGQLMNEHVEFPNPSVEIFCMNAITANTLEHIATIAHPLVRSPNDVVGSTDGKSFWVTNDGSHQRGFAVR